MVTIKQRIIDAISIGYGDRVMTMTTTMMAAAFAFFLAQEILTTMYKRRQQHWKMTRGYIEFVRASYFSSSENFVNFHIQTS